MISEHIPLQDKYLYIITDQHGNYTDFQYYLNLWLQDTSNHIVFTGDLIHSHWPGNDNSLEILDTIKKYLQYPTFHVLLGNHEWSQIHEENCYKYFINQTEEFYKQVETKYPDNTLEKYQEYKNLLRKFKYYITTSNGFYISHTGIHEDYLEAIKNNIQDIDDLNNITLFEKELLTECIWSRPYDDYNENTIQSFLDYLNLDYMISGHTPYTPGHIIGNQLIFDNSQSKEKYYLKIKLDKTYSDIISVMKELKKKE